MPDFYFRGTIVQYWQFTYAEYDRLSSIFGAERFEFFSPDPKQGPLPEYQPDETDQVHFIIWDADHKGSPVRVRAGTSLGSDLVEMHVSIYVGVLNSLGKSCLDVWNAYVNSLEERGLLLKPADLLASLPAKPPIPKSGADLDAYFDLRQNKLKSGHKYTLKKIAEDTQYAYRYVRQLHSKYLKKRRRSQPKRTNKRTNKN